MRKIVGSSLFLLCLLPVLARGDCLCKEPVRPELPPDKPTVAEMGQTNGEVSAYAEAMKQYRECLVKCVRSAERDMNSIVTDWNELVDKFTRGGKEKK